MFCRINCSFEVPKISLQIKIYFTISCLLPGRPPQAPLPVRRLPVPYRGLQRARHGRVLGPLPAVQHQARPPLQGPHQHPGGRGQDRRPDHRVGPAAGAGAERARRLLQGILQEGGGGGGEGLPAEDAQGTGEHRALRGQDTPEVLLHHLRGARKSRTHTNICPRNNGFF